MDKIEKISWNAFTNYFHIAKKIGYMNLQDRSKLLILSFFYDLIYNSDYMYTYIPNESSTLIGKWEIGRKREKEVYAKFNQLMKCLSNKSCFIKNADGYCSNLDKPTWKFRNGVVVLATNDSIDANTTVLNTNENTSPETILIPN